MGQKMDTRLNDINNTMEAKVRKTKKGRIYPHIWKSGPDPVLHNLRISCLRAKAQAKFRNEGWELTIEEYTNMWLENDNYKSKGRGSYDLSLQRLDYDLPWSTDNCVIQERYHYLRACKK